MTGVGQVTLPEGVMLQIVEALLIMSFEEEPASNELQVGVKEEEEDVSYDSSDY